ncbi:hypothetical protein HanIR_Chr17g0880011 [Helianthus annuus]|nr:hypothetical protein HanIR_Chr17g0880011 [Helianthus annuus]KAJ0798469.1 hypothetical protein HanLR1_Chr00c3007g0864441 [Helianthus annuus]
MMPRISYYRITPTASSFLIRALNFYNGIAIATTHTLETSGFLPPNLLRSSTLG